MSAHERVEPWTPPVDWSFRRMFHAAHACGWTLSHTDKDPSGFHERCDAHAAECPWPDEPPLVETVSD